MKIHLSSPLDMHLHLREGGMLKRVAPLSAEHFAGAVIMPNLQSSVDSVEAVLAYKKAVLEACGGHQFTPYMTLFFRNYSREELMAAQEHIIGVKLYPAGITTQSDKGVADFDSIAGTVGLLEELGIPLLVHGETNGFVMEREREFLPLYQWLAESFPKLSIVMEHITTADAVAFLERFNNVWATVTLHHLMITLDDVVGGLMQPELFCKPIAKTPQDREALREAVFSGHTRIVFGSDSAPHPRHRKECCGCAAGVFTAPLALPMLAQLFEDAGCLELLQDFVSGSARKLYQIEPIAKQLTLEPHHWTIPEMYGDIIAFCGGREIKWAVTDIRGSK